MVAKRWAGRLMSLASTMVLARLLLPEDYGLWALALSLSLLFEVVTQLHFDLALIRKAEVEREDLDTAWTLNIASNTLIALLLSLAAPLLASITRAPQVAPLIWCVAFCIFLDGLHNIGMVLWRRQLVFTKEVTQDMSSKAVEILVAIGVAQLHPSVWALAAGMVAGRSTCLLLTYVLHSYRPRLQLSRWRGLMEYSSWAMAYSFLDQLSRSADAFILGRMLGMSSVGLFANARDLAALPTSELAHPIGRSLFPAFSNLLAEPQRLRDAYLKALGGVLLLALPFAIGLVFVADAAVLILLGPRWVEAVPIVQGMALAQVVALSGASRVPLLMAQGCMKALVARACLVLVLRPLFVVLAVLNGGLHAVPWAVMAALAVGVVFDGVVVGRSLSFGPRYWLARTWRPYVSVALMSLALWLWLPGTPIDGIAQALLRLAAAAVIATPVYLASVFTVWHLSGRPDTLEATLLGILRRRLGLAAPG